MTYRKNSTGLTVRPILGKIERRFLKKYGKDWKTRLNDIDRIIYNVFKDCHKKIIDELAEDPLIEISDMDYFEEIDDVVQFKEYKMTFEACNVYRN